MWPLPTLPELDHLAGFTSACVPAIAPGKPSGSPALPDSRKVAERTAHLILPSMVGSTFIESLPLVVFDRHLPPRPMPALAHECALNCSTKNATRL